jgi:hypothetical protein
MQTKKISIDEARKQFKALVKKDRQYKKFAKELGEGLDNLEKFNVKDQAQKNNVTDFRKLLHSWMNSKDALITKPEFQKIVYDALIAAAITSPVNDADAITSEELSEIPKDSVIFLTDGYFCDVRSIVDWIKNKGVMENPTIPGQPLHLGDITALLEAGKKLNIDLKNLKPEEYKVEEHLAILEGAITIAEGRSAASQPFSMFNSHSKFIRDLAGATGLDPDYLVTYQSQHPYRFAKLTAASPYIQKGLLSTEQATTLSNDVTDKLIMLNTEENLTDQQLTEKFQRIVSSAQAPRRR